MNTHTLNHTLRLGRNNCFTSFAFERTWTWNCTEVTYYRVVLAALWVKNYICCQKTHDYFKSAKLPPSYFKMQLHRYQFNYRCSTLHTFMQILHTVPTQVCGRKAKVLDLLCGDSPTGLSVSLSSKTITYSQLHFSPSLHLLTPSLAAFHLTVTPLFSLLVNCIPFPFSRKQERKRETVVLREMWDFVCLLIFLSRVMMT